MQRNGFPTVTPRITVEDPAGLVAFIKEVFGAEGELPNGRPAELVIGDSMVMVSGTIEREAMTAFLYVYVEDVDATHQRALAAGAAEIEAPAQMPYGDRRGMIRDRWGNTWQIASCME